MLDSVSKQEVWRFASRLGHLFHLLSLFKRFHNSFIVRWNDFEVRLWCNLGVIAQLLFDVIFYLLAIHHDLLEEGLLQTLNLSELIFIADYASHCCDELSELWDRLHFVQVEIGVLDFFVDSSSL